MPGISVAPMPSMVCAPPEPLAAEDPKRDPPPRVICLMRLPCTSTSPV